VGAPTETQEAGPARVGRFDEAILAISRGRQWRDFGKQDYPNESGVVSSFPGLNAAGVSPAVAAPFKPRILKSRWPGVSEP